MEFENDLELDLSEEKEEEEGEEEEEDEFKEEEDMPKKLTKRQQISKLKQLKEQGQGEEFEESIDIESYHMQLPDKKPRKKRNALMTEEQQIKKLEKVCLIKLIFFFFLLAECLFVSFHSSFFSIYLLFILSFFQRKPDCHSILSKKISSKCFISFLFSFPSYFNSIQIIFTP